MEDKIVIETIKIIDGTTYIIRSLMPSKKDVKVIKDKVKKMVLNNVESIKNNTESLPK